MSGSNTILQLVRVEIMPENSCKFVFAIRMHVRHVDLQASNFNAILYHVDTGTAENDTEGMRESWDGLSFIPI